VQRLHMRPLADIGVVDGRTTCRHSPKSHRQRLRMRPLVVDATGDLANLTAAIWPGVVDLPWRLLPIVPFKAVYSLTCRSQRRFLRASGVVFDKLLQLTGYSVKMMLAVGALVARGGDCREIKNQRCARRRFVRSYS
jgi:hypothetical protein